MQVHTFIADSAADAVGQIRAQLGPQAVVLNVRPLPSEGLARFEKPRIEVLAYVPDASASPAHSGTEAVAQLRQELSDIRQRVDGRGEASSTLDLLAGDKAAEQALNRLERAAATSSSGTYAKGGWRIGPLLENSGLLTVQAHSVLEQLRTRHGDTPPASLARELDLASLILREIWLRTPAAAGLTDGAHVLIGAPGVGKTVCLCKWLAQTVLVEGRKASVWRLDGRTANTAEALSVYCEILAVPVERCLPEVPNKAQAELLLIDLPGVTWNDPAALTQLGQQLASLPNTQVHLVLNAAYESPSLAQPGSGLCRFARQRRHFYALGRGTALGEDLGPVLHKFHS